MAGRHVSKVPHPNTMLGQDRGPKKPGNSAACFPQSGHLNLVQFPAFADVQIARIIASRVAGRNRTQRLDEPRGCTATFVDIRRDKAREMPAIALEDWRRKP